MCGVGGILFASTTDLRERLEAMNASMVHRGPDDAGVELFPQIGAGLAARRLSLVDLEAGHQPMSNQDGSVWAVLNGEIYNHAALREQLRERGHRFRSHCDTEVLAHLYEEEGPAMLSRLEGMFGLAILDVRREQLLLARDRIGMKPMYYARTSQGFVFASEVKAILATGMIRAEPDWAGVDAALTLQFLPAPVTGFVGISKLAAGEQLVLTRGGATTRRYWSFGFRHGEIPASPEEAGRELERRLTAAVASHMTADVPVGVFLSGGIDSSLTAALAARTSPARLKSFSIVFPDDPNMDERRYSRIMAQAIGSEHHELEFRAAMMPDLVDDTVEALEEPTSTSPAILFFSLSRLASPHVKAVLTGEGADELFAGYNVFRTARWYHWRRRFPPWLRALGGGILGAAAEWSGSARYETIAHLLAAPDDAHADLEVRRAYGPSQKRRLLGSRRAMPDLEPFLLPAVTAATCASDLERLLATDVLRRLGDGLLLTAEKMTMAHALEQRMPFLDPSVVAFAEGLDSSLKLRAGKEKFILTQLGHLLPPEIVARHKQGLRHPATARSPAMMRMLRERLLGEGRLFRQPMVRRELDQLAAGNLAAAPRAWTLLVVQCWWDRFFGHA